MNTDNTAKPKVEAVIHRENLTEEERAKFNHTLTINEIIKALREGSNGCPILVTRKDKPGDNILVEYKKRS